MNANSRPWLLKTLVFSFFCFAFILFLNNRSYCNGHIIYTSTSKITKSDYDTSHFVDSRDGKTYKTIKIDKQTWMAENLAFASPVGARLYDNKPEFLNQFGYLYNWETAQKSCPSGWHLPTDLEWRKLEMALGMSKGDTGLSSFRGNVGALIKSNNGWHTSPKENLSIGFNAMPGGFFSADDSTYNDMKYNAYFWTSTSPKPEFVWERDLFDTFVEISRNRYKKSYGFSVRCIKD